MPEHLSSSRFGDVMLRRFEQPDETRPMQKGSFEVVRLGGTTIGRAIYQPGWRWSDDVGQALNQQYCAVEHLGLVLAGTLVAQFSRNGHVIALRAGDLFYIPPEPHDSWVVGTEPYVSVHIIGAGKYTR
ncbi:MAG TPA: hypothetical protein VLB12_09835 [Gemmatimonadales bacterium]|nr:hypothetical protein [Gemmatimonadales bacterium]